MCGERMGDGGDGDGGDGGASYARKTTQRLTGEAGLPARGSAREGAAARWGRLVSERPGGEWGGCARAGAGRQLGRKGGGEARARGGVARRGPDSAQQGGRESFLFFFLFSKSHFHFCFFSF
jgi:hypothetical protein